MAFLIDRYMALRAPQTLYPNIKKKLILKIISYVKKKSITKRIDTIEEKSSMNIGKYD
jgi:hypothetical protein